MGKHQRARAQSRKAEYPSLQSRLLASRLLGKHKRAQAQSRKADYPPLQPCPLAPSLRSKHKRAHAQSLKGEYPHPNHDSGAAEPSLGPAPHHPRGLKKNRKKYKYLERKYKNSEIFGNLGKIQKNLEKSRNT